MDQNHSSKRFKLMVILQILGFLIPSIIACIALFRSNNNIIADLRYDIINNSCIEIYLNHYTNNKIICLEDYIGINYYWNGTKLTINTPTKQGEPIDLKGNTGLKGDTGENGNSIIGPKGDTGQAGTCDHLTCQTIGQSSDCCGAYCLTCPASYNCTNNKCLPKMFCSSGYMFENRCYMLYESSVNWDTANNLCKNVDRSELVSIRNIVEFNYVIDILKLHYVCNGDTNLYRSGNTWIGLHQEFVSSTNLTWTDGSLLTYGIWYPGEPSFTSLYTKATTIRSYTTYNWMFLTKSEIVDCYMCVRW